MVTGVAIPLGGIAAAVLPNASRQYMHARSCMELLFV